MVLSAGTLFAFNGIVSKLLLRGGFDALQLTAFRAGGAFLGLLLINAAVRPGLRRLVLRRAEVPRIIGFGLTGFFLVPLLYFVTIRRLPVGIGLLFEYTAPLLVALWVRFGEGRPVRHRLWLGLVLSLGGLASVAEIWTGGSRLDPVGVVAGFASAVLLATFFVVGSKSVADRDPLSLTCWAFGVSAVCGAVVRPWWRFPAGLLQGTSDGVPMWLLAIYLIFGGTIASYLLISSAMRHLPPTSVGILGMVEPPLAAAFAWITLAEVLSPAQLIGGVVVLAGVALAETARAGMTGQPHRVAPDIADIPAVEFPTPQLPPV
jgi:drug/metabolite transporter (DMT)-like permease